MEPEDGEVVSKAHLEPPAFYEKTLVNARRLLEDSKLLADHDRPQSSVILGIFAIEELGKALIARWGVRNRASRRDYPSHVEKQAATFALMSAVEQLANVPRMKKYWKRGSLNFNKIGPHSHQFAHARAGFYDDLRMSMTYADEEPKYPDELRDIVCVGLARELHGYFEKALANVEVPLAMELAAIAYENDLGRL